MRNLIREGKIHQIPSAMQTGQKVGMQTLDMALRELVRRNLVSADEAQSKTNTPNLFNEPEGLGSGNGSGGRQAGGRLGGLIR